MKNRKIAVFLAVCLGTVFFSGCGSDMKNYRQASSNLEAEKYDEALQEFETAIAAGVNLAGSYRGAGVANVHLGNYKEAIENFTDALNCKKVGKSLKKDILSYRAAADLKIKAYDEAMADCQSIAADYDMDADVYFLTGEVALAMDSYEEASTDFEQAYGEEATYDMAIRIYSAYLEKDMEADGTRYLEAALSKTADNAQDHCDRGRVYYYMGDYDNAQKELQEAADDGNTEAVLLQGMVYMEQKDTASARKKFEEYVSQAEDSARGFNGLALCDIEDGDYDSALSNISSALTFAEGEELKSLLFNEMTIYEKKLDFVTAKQKAEEYLELYPDDKTMKKELAFLKTRVTGQNENSGAETTAEAAAVDSNAADSANTDSSEEQ